MSSRDEFRSRCEYYGGKCRQQLYRTRLSCNLAADHIGNVLGPGDAPVKRYEPLLAESIETTERTGPQVRHKLLKIIVQSHFLNLKVNFEYFLNRILHCLWSCQFEQLAARTNNPLLKGNIPLREVAWALAAGNDGGKDYVLNTVIPVQGLCGMAECFEATSGQSLTTALDASDARLWSQIHSAFEVRHLIEHRNGKMDQKFLDRVTRNKRWKNSSWADFPVELMRPIEIRPSDFDATCDAMIPAAEVITRLASNYWAEYPPTTPSWSRS